MHLNIIHPSKPGSPKWSLSFRFPLQNPVYSSPLSHALYIPRPYHSSRFCHPKDIGWGVQIIKLLIMLFSPLPFHFVPLRPKYLRSFENDKKFYPGRHGVTCRETWFFNFFWPSISCKCSSGPRNRRQINREQLLTENGIISCRRSFVPCVENWVTRWWALAKTQWRHFRPRSHQRTLRNTQLCCSFLHFNVLVNCTCGDKMFSACVMVVLNVWWRRQFFHLFRNGASLRYAIKIW